MSERTCEMCGVQYVPGRTWKKMDRCGDCRSVGTCSVCNGRTVRTAASGKVPTICSTECRRELGRRSFEHLKKDAGAYHRHKRVNAMKARQDRFCLECSEPIPFIEGARRPVRCDACRPKHERIRTQAKDRNRHWRRNGIDMDAERFEKMIADQNGGCAICRRTVKHWHVDHCHETGATRELLCASCNMALGQLGDDPLRLRVAAEYIEKHRANKESHV